MDDEHLRCLEEKLNTWGVALDLTAYREERRYGIAQLLRKRRVGGYIVTDEGSTGVWRDVCMGLTGVKVIAKRTFSPRILAKLHAGNVVVLDGVVDLYESPQWRAWHAEWRDKRVYTIILETPDVSAPQIKRFIGQLPYTDIREISCQMSFTVSLDPVTQTRHVDAVNAIWSQSDYAFDLSSMGSGKTYTGMALSYQFDKTIVVCPAFLRGKWERLTARYRVDIETVFSHNTTHSSKHEIISASGGGFECNPAFERRTRGKRILVIFDEVQYLKIRKSRTASSSVALVNCVLSNNKGSKILMLSGTPFDKTAFVESFFLLMGAMPPEENLPNDEIVYRCNRFVEDLEARIPIARDLERDMISAGVLRRFAEVREGYVERRSDLDAYLYTLFLYIVRPRLSARMIAEFPFRLYVENRIAPTPPGLLAAQRPLRGAKSQERQSELCKLPLIVAAVERTLTETPSARVVVGVFFRQSFDVLVSALAAYAPAILHGGISRGRREQTLASFQDNEIAVLIVNVTVASSGIDLDDKTGNAQRIVFVAPNYRAIDLIQFYSRFVRINSKFPAFVYNIYLLGDERLQAALDKKGKIMREMSTMPTVSDFRDPEKRFPITFFDEFDTTDLSIEPDAATVAVVDRLLSSP